MKKIFIFCAGIILLSSLALAMVGGPEARPGQAAITSVGQGNAEANKSSEVPMAPDNPQADGRLQNRQSDERSEAARAKKLAKVRERIEAKKASVEKDLEKAGNKRKEVLKNQNKVRVAVHSLLAMDNLTGGIGPQIREIARNFNNSVKETIESEEKIRKRGAFARFFIGGNKDAAEKLQAQLESNRERIQELNRLRENCNCSNEIRGMMTEQVQKMQQEHSRLNDLAQKEKKSKGIFGWLWK